MTLVKKDVGDILSHNANLEIFYHNGNNLLKTGAKRISKALQHFVNFIIIFMKMVAIREEAFDEITTTIS